MAEPSFNPITGQWMARPTSTLDTLSFLSSNGQTPQVPFSPAPNVSSLSQQMPYSPGFGIPGGVQKTGTEFTWRNPYSYTPWDQSKGFGDYLGNNMNLFQGVAGLGLAGLGAWMDWQQLGLAKDALKQEKKAFNINLANNTQSYNTQVGDRIAGRWYASEADRQAALDAATLTDRSSYAKKDKKGGGG